MKNLIVLMLLVATIIVIVPALAISGGKSLPFVICFQATCDEAVTGALNGMRAIQSSSDALPDGATLFKRYREIIFSGEVPSPLKTAIELEIVDLTRTEGNGTVARGNGAEFDQVGVERVFLAALAAARCSSGSAPGPSNPSQIPAQEVKDWMLSVASNSQWGRINRPLIAVLPAESLKWAWLRAVEVKRNLPFKALSGG